jgi:hypothetical protein
MSHIHPVIPVGARRNSEKHSEQSRDELTAWATRSSDGELLAGVMAYEWGWRRFQPRSRTWRYEGKVGR